MPKRVVAGTATEKEQTCWRMCYESALHELLSHELVDAIATHIIALLSPADSGGGGGGCGGGGGGGGGGSGGETAVVVGATGGTGGGGGGGTTQAAATTPGTLPVVLECGAGNGVLSHHLAQRLEGLATVIATDDFSSEIAALTTKVLPLTCKQALEQFSPAVVLCSWMPSGVDFTGDMRKCPAVRHILLLGETGTSTCGNAWATWGVVRYSNFFFFFFLNVVKLAGAQPPPPTHTHTTGSVARELCRIAPPPPFMGGFAAIKLAPPPSVPSCCKRNLTILMIVPAQHFTLSGSSGATVASSTSTGANVATTGSTKTRQKLTPQTGLPGPPWTPSASGSFAGSTAQSAPATRGLLRFPASEPVSVVGGLGWA